MSPRTIPACLAVFAAGTFFLTSGCATPEQTLGALAGATAFGGQAPAHELQQTYYLGVFDPQGQLPPAIYRVTVHGQASLISMIRFSSGWAPADAVDSLGSRVEMDLESGRITMVKENDSAFAAALSSGRRQVLFGPEGFREAPRDHRLVILMGSSAEKYFEQISGGAADPARVNSIQDLLVNLQSSRIESLRLNQLKTDFAK